MLTDLKKTDAIFCLPPFLDIKKSILTNFKKPGAIFCLSLFQILKKSILKNFKKPDAIFCLSPFHNNNFKGNNLHKNHYTNQ